MWRGRFYLVGARGRWCRHVGWSAGRARWFRPVLAGGTVRQQQPDGVHKHVFHNGMLATKNDCALSISQTQPCQAQQVACGMRLHKDRSMYWLVHDGRQRFKNSNGDFSPQQSNGSAGGPSPHRLVHEPRQAPDTILYGRRLAFSLAPRRRRRSTASPGLRRPPTTPSVAASRPVAAGSGRPCTLTSASSAVSLQGAMFSVEVVGEGVVVPLLRAPSAAVRRRGGVVAVSAAVSAAALDGPVVVSTSCSIRVWHGGSTTSVC